MASSVSQAVLFFPEGPDSRFFYGRAASGGGGPLLSLLCAQAVEQNDCMYMGGEGEIAVDVGLRRAPPDGRECVIRGVALSGGALAQLHTSAATEELARGGEALPGGAAAPLPLLPPPLQLPPGAPRPATLHFEPQGLKDGALAAADARAYFPEVVASALAQRGPAVEAGFLIVRGQLQLRNCAWREGSSSSSSSRSSSGGGGGSSAAPPPHPDSLAALLLRSFAGREGAGMDRCAREECGEGGRAAVRAPAHQHCGGGSASASASASSGGWEVSHRRSPGSSGGGGGHSH